MTPIDILTARQAMGWSRSDLAQRLNVSERTVRAWEAGVNKPSGPTSTAIAYLLRDVLEQGNGNG